MFCYKCGKQLPEGAAFCVHCGNRVGEAAAPAAPAAPVQPPVTPVQVTPPVTPVTPPAPVVQVTPPVTPVSFNAPAEEAAAPAEEAAPADEEATPADEVVVEQGVDATPAEEVVVEAEQGVDATPAEIVYVLPNNKNIIMAAEQCARLCEDKKVVVLPSKTVPQGISAMMVVDLDGDEEANTESMTAALANVATSEVTYAARDSDFDGFAITQGDYMALADGKLFGTEQDICAMLEQLAQAAGEEKSDVDAFLQALQGGEEA